MPLFNTETSLLKTPKKAKFFGDTDPDTGKLFAGLPTGEEGDDTQALVGDNLKGMLSGSAYDASKTQNRETFARAATNLRAQTGGQAAEGGMLGQGSANKAQQGAESKIFQGLADTEMAINTETQAMKERGVTAATGIGKAQQDVLTQRRGQDMSLLQSREQTQAQKDIAANALGLDTAKLAESARQFNISTEQASKQFSESLNRDYAELSQADKQFLSSLGFDQAKFEESKKQFQQSLEQEGRLTMAQLGVQEKQIAEGARQFNSRLEFDNSELTANLSEAEKNRVWQALQNDKASINAKEIATMQNDTERWKTDQATALTEKGWTVEQAENALNRTLQQTLQNKDIALQREIETGRITEAQAARIQQADQFTDELEWNKEATRLGITAEEAARAWQSKENIANRAFTATESSLDRQLNKEVASGMVQRNDGTWVETTEMQQILNQASQFKDELDWQKTAKDLDLDEVSTARVWQASEAAKDRVHQANLQQIENEFIAKGWNFQALMSSIDALPEEQVADVLSEVAASSGIRYPATNPDGTDKVDADGNTIMVPGLKTYTPVFSESDQSAIYHNIAKGNTITESDAKIISSDFSKLVKDGKAISDNSIENTNLVSWTTSGMNRWAPSDAATQWTAANAGKIYKASNGKYYTVVGISSPKDRGSMGGIIFKDLVGGQEFKLTRGAKFPESGE